MTTTDLIKRLRRSNHEWVKGGHAALQALANEAADEIERQARELAIRHERETVYGTAD